MKTINIKKVIKGFVVAIDTTEIYNVSKILNISATTEISLLHFQKMKHQIVTISIPASY
jgi:hypothetical protein